MFVIEFGAVLQTESLSLTGDSLDMLGDALVYGTSLYVIHRSAKAQTGAALLKGVIMFGFAIAVFTRAIYQCFVGVVAAAGLVLLAQSPIPDLLVGLLLTVVFARSAGTVLSQSWQAISAASLHRHAFPSHRRKPLWHNKHCPLNSVTRAVNDIHEY